MDQPKYVVFLGKIGHGKTHLLNKICGQDYPSNMGTKSCTRSIQSATTLNHSIGIIDTPGFYSSDNVQEHIAAQKYALEKTKLHGIYILIRYGRVDDMAETLNKIMDFVGNDDIRIIITHGDIVQDQEGFSLQDTMKGLSNIMDVPIRNISMFGKHSSAIEIENFIQSTLHEPRSFEISKEQSAFISTLTVGPRRVDHMITKAYAKIDAIKVACQDLVPYSSTRTHESDVIISLVRGTLSATVEGDLKDIHQAMQDLTPEEQALVDRKRIVDLQRKLKRVLNITKTKCLSWDTNDAKCLQNIYRQCNYCSSVYKKAMGIKMCQQQKQQQHHQGRKSKKVANIKLYGIDFQFIKMELEQSTTSSSAATTSFSFAPSLEYVVKFLVNGSAVAIPEMRRSLPDYIVVSPQENVYCGKAINWETMPPIHPKSLEQQGEQGSENSAYIRLFRSIMYVCFGCFVAFAWQQYFNINNDDVSLG